MNKAESQEPLCGGDMSYYSTTKVRGDPATAAAYVRDLQRDVAKLTQQRDALLAACEAALKKCTEIRCRGESDDEFDVLELQHQLCAAIDKARQGK